MKTIYSILFLILSASLFAQSPVLPLDTPYHQITNDAYLKDTQNQLLPFEGTWGYQLGNTKVTIRFQKIMDYNDLSNPKYYEDVLNANYKIEKNGVVVYNDLDQPIGENSKIYGISYSDGRYQLSYLDYPKCGIMGNVEIWIENGKLKWTMEMTDPNPYSREECPESNNENFLDAMTIPYVMTMTKL